MAFFDNPDSTLFDAGVEYFRSNDGGHPHWKRMEYSCKTKRGMCTGHVYLHESTAEIDIERLCNQWTNSDYEYTPIKHECKPRTSEKTGKTFTITYITIEPGDRSDIMLRRQKRKTFDATQDTELQAINELINWTAHNDDDELLHIETIEPIN